MIRTTFISSPLDKMATTLADDKFKFIFVNGNDIISIRFSLEFVPRSPIDNNLVLVQVMVAANAEWSIQGIERTKIHNHSFIIFFS